MSAEPTLGPPPDSADAVGFTGARSIVSEQERLVEAALAVLDPSRHVVVTGGCIGIDRLVAVLAHVRGLHVHTILPADRSRLDLDWRQHCTSYEEMPIGTDYRARNERLVARSKRLVALPAHPEDDPRSKRSGTWMTVRIARQAVKPIVVLLPETATEGSPRSW